MWYLTIVYTKTLYHRLDNFRIAYLTDGVLQFLGENFKFSFR